MVTGLAVACYLPSLSFDLVWDDPISIQRWLPALQRWRDFFFPPANIPQFPYSYYRPLQLLSYALDAKLGAGSPWAFHASSVFWHATSTALTFATARLLFAPLGASASALALTAAALFATHPIHTESVAWMAARPDPMVATFGLASLHLALRATASLWTLLLGSALLGAALLSKENALSLCILVPLAARLHARAWQLEPKRRTSKDGHDRRHGSSGRLALWQKWEVCSGTVLVLYFLLRWLAPTGLTSAEMELPDRWFSTLVGSVGFYLRKLFWPFPQNAYVAEVPSDLAHLAFGVAALFGLALLAWPKLYRRAPVEAFCGLWIALSLLPSLAVLLNPPIAPLAERYLYIPSVAFCWLAGRGVAGLRSRRFLPSKALHALVAVLVASAAICTFKRSEVWRDNVSLWADTAHKNPRDGFAQRNLGAALLERGHLDEGERALRSALEKRNAPTGLYAIYSNLGTVAMRRQQWQQAENFYREALQVLPGAADVTFNLGAAMLARAQSLAANHPDRLSLIEKAHEAFAQTASASPFDPDVQVALAHVLMILNRPDEALVHYERAVELGLPGPRAEEVRNRIAEIQKTRGQAP